MPIYEYRCRKCGATSEFFAASGKTDAITCRSCGSADMEKIMSPAAVIGRSEARTPGRSCCGRSERCETPPCSGGGSCRRG